MYFLDIRHWFHQLPVCGFLQDRFCLRMKSVDGKSDEYYSWRVSPMGWSWSPRLCQCTAWAMILRPKNKKLRYRFDLPTDLGSPPRFVKVYNRSTNESAGFVTLLYDNVGFFCNDPHLGKELHDQVQENAEKCHIILKDSSAPGRTRSTLQSREGAGLGSTPQQTQQVVRQIQPRHGEPRYSVWKRVRRGDPEIPHGVEV